MTEKRPSRYPPGWFELTREERHAMHADGSFQAFYVKGCSTQELLRYRDRCYAVNGGTIRDPEQASYSPWEYSPGIKLSVILEELATRPHVPNKAERKAERQANAKRKQNR